jgi:mitotic spindle assembly checkpoint protein MAD2
VQSTKSQKEITQEIQAVVRQITASVTFLPLLNEPCFFDLLVYADEQASVPLSWEDSDPCHILNAEDVRLRSFDTKVKSPSLITLYSHLCVTLCPYIYSDPQGGCHGVVSR